VEVQYELSDDRIAVEVTDDGAGFDPEVLERGQEELDEGGLGIAIIRAITDELEIGARDGGGSRLRFTKYFS
jgi:anti-sigma regulatory factor (Ser/Thr protein kinase)